MYNVYVYLHQAEDNLNDISQGETKRLSMISIYGF